MTAAEFPADKKIVDELGFDSLLVYEVLVVVEEVADVYLGDEPIDLRGLTLRNIFELLCALDPSLAEQTDVEPGPQ